MQKVLTTVFILYWIVQGAMAQTMQIKFCGKTTNVTPATDGTGSDQRHKGALRLDFIRVGRVGTSKTNPFYNLGNSGALTFKNNTWVDGCGNNQNQTYCSGCTKCTFITDNSNKSLGVSEGKMQGNVRLRSNNNDLFIESTGDQNVVCFVTDPFDVTAHGGKKIEVNVGYEGTKLETFETRNVSFSYKYAGMDWKQLLNQNSNFLRVIDTTIFVLESVPVAVENLDGTVDIQVSPNPVVDALTIEMDSRSAFDGMLSILSSDLKISSLQNIQIPQGLSRHQIEVKDLKSGLYILQIGDSKGRISSRKFIKM